MQIVTHVLTSPQSELRADTEEASARRKAARQNIGAVAGIKTESGPIEPDSEGYVQIPEVVDADENTKGIVKLTDNPTSEAANTAASPAAIRAALANFGGFQVVELDPQTGKPDVVDPSTKYIYLTKDSDSHETDPYTEWIWVVEEAPAEPHWDIIGTTSVDLSGYVEKVSGGTTGNVATLTNDGSIADSLIAGTDVAEAVNNKHIHSNKDTLDDITAAYTTEEQTKLTGIAEGAQVNVIEHITANGTELQPSSKTVNIPLAGNGDPGLMTDAEKTKLTGIETSAQVNVIEHIIAGDTELSPDNKTVTIPLATDETDGLLPSGMIGGITTAAEKSRIPAEPVAGADRIYSFDDTNGTSWQTIVKEYVGNMILDQQGTPVTDEKGDIMYDEEAVPLWLSYKGVEFGARRAYDDHTGANIHDSIASRTTMAQVTTAIETALANYGGFVVVASLVDGHPDVADPSERFIYLYKDSSGPVQDPYTEWIYTANHTWEVIGTTYVDLSPYYTSVEVESRLDTKVDKVTGKGLSTEDYTTEEKTKLSGIESGAQVNIIEAVKVDGTVLSVDANKAVNIPLASATDSGNETVYVTGAVTGQDKERWDSWKSCNVTIPDDEGDEIQDEEGNSIGDENSVELWTSFNGTGFGAERAVADVDGNPLNLTISNDQVIAIGGKSIGGGTVDAYTKAETDILLADKADKSELPILRQAEATENTTINVVNNRVTWVSNITYSTMTFNVAVPSGESANFAVELLSQHACTVSVTVNGVQVPKASAALNELEAGKTYQLTCVGYGWTCVEIDVPSYTVTIDSKTYGATRLGNHLWTTENLDYLFTGCTLNGTAENKPMAWNNSADPTYEGKYGIVYNYQAVLYLAEHADELLPSGWRLPTLDDWRQLGNTIGWDPAQSGQMVTGDKANAFRSTEWYLWNYTTQQYDIPGTNLYGLNVLPAGTFNNGEFVNIGKTGQFWASDSLDLSAHRRWKASVDSTYGWSYVDASLGSELLYTYGVNIRLIKDL